MLNLIFDGIVAKLIEAFGDGYKIYQEQVKQGLKTPCFLISCVNPTNEQFLGNRYYRTNLFSVQYFPQSNTDAKAECWEVQDTLYEALEYINVGEDLQRGTGMRGEFVDDILTFFVSFNMFVYKPTDEDVMETLTVENQAR